MNLRTWILALISIVQITILMGCSVTGKDWSEACRLNTIESYDSFAAAHPFDVLADSARTRVREMHAHKLLDSLTISGDLGGFVDFILQPNHQGYFDQAIACIEEIVNSRGIPATSADRQIVESYVLEKLRQSYEQFAGNLIYQSRNQDQFTRQICGSNVFYSKQSIKGWPEVAYLEKVDIVNFTRPDQSHTYGMLLKWRGVFYHISPKVIGGK